jgi:hypothetical protein
MKMKGKKLDSFALWLRALNRGSLLTLYYSRYPPRMSAQEILEHSFLAVEPEVVLLATDATKKQLTLQVVFKGMDRLSVKFEFNSDTDTAEEVVNEMVRDKPKTPSMAIDGNRSLAYPN